MEPPKTDDEIASKEKHEEKLIKIKEKLIENGITCRSHILIQGLTPGE